MKGNWDPSLRASTPIVAKIVGAKVSVLLAFYYLRQLNYGVTQQYRCSGGGTGQRVDTWDVPHLNSRIKYVSSRISNKFYEMGIVSLKYK